MRVEVEAHCETFTEVTTRQKRTLNFPNSNPFSARNCYYYCCVYMYIHAGAYRETMRKVKIYCGKSEKKNIYILW